MKPISFSQRGLSGNHAFPILTAVARTLNLHIVSANLQAAQSNRALLTLAVSVTRPTEQDSAQIRSIDSGSGVTWYQGRITADMIAQVNAMKSFSDELRYNPEKAHSATLITPAESCMCRE